MTAAPETAEDTAESDLHTTAGKLADLQRRNAALETDPQAAERQHAKGRNTARERLEMLLDPGSFVELDALTRHRSTNSHDSARPTRPARATWLKPWRRRHRAMRGPTSGGSVEMEDSLGRHDGVRACRRVAGWDGSGGRGRGVLAVLLSPAEQPYGCGGPDGCGGPGGEHGREPGVLGGSGGEAAVGGEDGPQPVGCHKSGLGR